jgi:hypothetical protein
VVAIIPDSGANYLDQIYNDEWLAEKGITLLDHNELDEHLSTKRIFDVEEYCSAHPCNLELSHVAGAL